VHVKRPPHRRQQILSCLRASSICSSPSSPAVASLRTATVPVYRAGNLPRSGCSERAKPAQSASAGKGGPVQNFNSRKASSSQRFCFRRLPTSVAGYRHGGAPRKSCVSSAMSSSRNFLIGLDGSALLKVYRNRLARTNTTPAWAPSIWQGDIAPIVARNLHAEKKMRHESS